MSSYRQFCVQLYIVFKMMSMEIELISWFQAKAYEVVEIPYIQRVSLLSNMLIYACIDANRQSLIIHYATAVPANCRTSIDVQVRPQSSALIMQSKEIFKRFVTLPTICIIHDKDQS